MDLDQVPATKKAKVKTEDGSDVLPSSSTQLYSKIKVGRTSGYPVLVKQGQSDHEAILLGDRDNIGPHRMLERHRNGNVTVRWRVAGYNQSVPASDVRCTASRAPPPQRSAASVAFARMRNGAAGFGSKRVLDAEPVAVKKEEDAVLDADTDTEDDCEKQSQGTSNNGDSEEIKRGIFIKTEEENHDFDTDTDTEGTDQKKARTNDTSNEKDDENAVIKEGQNLIFGEDTDDVDNNAKHSSSSGIGTRVVRKTSASSSSSAEEVRANISAATESSDANSDNDKVDAPECEFCHGHALVKEPWKEDFEARWCLNCGKNVCVDCGPLICCDGNCRNVYCPDCSDSCCRVCACDPDWMVCEDCIQECGVPPECEGGCHKFVCVQCQDNEEETSWNRCNECQSFTCEECCTSTKKCWCGKAWLCSSCNYEADYCEVGAGCGAWGCGKGKCKVKMNRDEEMACPDCRRIR